LHYRKLDPESFGFRFDFGERFLPKEFRRMDANDRQAAALVLVVPDRSCGMMLRQLNSTISPKLDQNAPTL
jgi:hypothetical protein